MAAITAALVGELRAKTDAPMMECKKALTEAEGDLVRAEEILRVKLGNKASKAASRVTAEGIVAQYVTDESYAPVWERHLAKVSQESWARLWQCWLEWNSRNGPHFYRFGSPSMVQLPAFDHPDVKPFAT